MFSFELRSGKIERGTAEAAAFDLFYSGEKPLEIGDSPVAIPTGVKTAFDPGIVAIIKEKSGLALKGLEVKGGVIDSDYRDEWKVIARCPIRGFSTSAVDMGHVIPGTPRIVPCPDWAPFIVQPGMKVAQFIILLLPQVKMYAMEGATLNLKEAVRGGGFGSTGK